MTTAEEKNAAYRAELAKKAGVTTSMPKPYSADQLKALPSAPNIDPVTGKPYTDVQLKNIQSQYAQLTGAKTPQQALKEREADTAAALKSSKTINNYTSQDSTHVAAQNAQNEKYGLDPLTGFKGTAINKAEGVTMDRDFAREQEAAKKVGITNLSKITPDQERNLFKMAYTPDELTKLGLNDVVNPPPVQTAGTGMLGGTSVAGTMTANLGGGQSLVYSPEKLAELGLTPERLQSLIDSGNLRPEMLQKLQESGDMANKAKGVLDSTAKPTNSMLNVLERALNAKSNITNQKLGESDLFKAAGLGGYAVLGESLGQRSREMNDKYNSFKTTVGDTAGGMTDVYNAAMNGYKQTMDEYNTQMDRLMKVDSEARDYERQIELLDKKQGLDMEMEAYKAELQSKYAKDDTKLQLQFNPLTGEEVVFNPSTGERTRSDGTKFSNSDDKGYTQSGDQIYDNDSIDQALGLGDKGKWCAEYTNDMTDGPKLGDDWAGKLKIAQKYNNRESAEIGNTIVIPLGVQTGVGWGHAVLVTGFDPETGEIDVMESNADGKKKAYGDGKGVVTKGTYNINDLNKAYGDQWGVIPTTLKPQYAKQLKTVEGGQSYSDIVEEATALGYNMTDPKVRANVLDNVKKGIKLTMDSKLADELDNDKSVASVRIANTVLPLAKQYQSLVNSFNDNEGFVMSGEKKALLDSTYSQLLLKFKDAEKLGVLAGLDMNVIRDTIKPITGGPWEGLSFMQSGGMGGAKVSINSVVANMESQKTQSYADLTTRRAGLVNSEYFKLLKNGDTSAPTQYNGNSEIKSLINLSKTNGADSSAIIDKLKNDPIVGAQVKKMLAVPGATPEKVINYYMK